MNASNTTWRALLHPGDATGCFMRMLQLFDPSTSRYCEGNALWLAELSRLVYRRDVEERNPLLEPTRSRFLNKAHLRQRCFFHEPTTNITAILVESQVPPPFAVLVFRGTEQGVKNFVIDLEFGTGQLDHEAEGMQKGFKRAFDSLWKEVDAAVRCLKGPVVYTGHSLGATLATMAAARRKPQAVYTVGSLRVGNKAFARSLCDVCIYRVVNDRDVVTRVPPQVLGFRHVGELKLLKAPVKGFFFSLLAWLRHSFSPLKLLADHTPINYVDRISQSTAV